MDAKVKSVFQSQRSIVYDSALVDTMRSSGVKLWVK